MAASHTPSERGGLNLEIPVDDLNESIRALVARSPRHRFIGVSTPQELAVWPRKGEKIIHGTFGYRAVVFAEVHEKFGHFSWNSQRQKTRGKVYLMRNGVKADGDRRGKPIYLHREIMGGPDLPGHIHVDHYDGNTMNCRDTNLIPCTRMENHFKKKRGDGYQGVSLVWGKEREIKYRVRAQFGGNEYFLGVFEDQIEGARAYDRKIVEFYLGKINHRFLVARLNLPNELADRLRELGLVHGVTYRVEKVDITPPF